VHYDPGVIKRRYLMNVMGCNAGAFYGSLLIAIVQSLSRKKSRSTVGKL
jgi:hypothetical protein